MKESAHAPLAAVPRQIDLRVYKEAMKNPKIKTIVLKGLSRVEKKP